MFRLNPVTKKKLERFYKIKRGYYSLVILSLLILFSLFAEFFINSKALVVKYDGKMYFPTYASEYSGKTFGQEYDYEAEYRNLKKAFKKQDQGNWVLMPFFPYDPYETIERYEKSNVIGMQPLVSPPPNPPDFSQQVYLGTDTAGRDILARLIYGFRIAILFSFALVVLTYSVGISVGCMMGYFGGMFDMVMQRIIEIWSNVPFLYVVIIVASMMEKPSFSMLLIIMAFFGWYGITYYLRAATYKEKAREYVMAARSLGASPFRVIFKHIIPNTISIIVTFAPFAISGGIVSLTSLDYLGFGLPAPTPSWGELLDQGSENIDAWWIVTSVVFMMVIVLTMVTFIGEAIREAFDPKKFAIYE